MTRLIAQIVEGHGEVASVPQLLSSGILAAGQTGGATGASIWYTQPAINAGGRGNLVVPGGLEANIRIARRIPDVYAIVIVLDAEKEAACQVGPALLARAEVEAGEMPVRICLAVRQYENWLAASAIQGAHWIPADGDFEGAGALASIRERLGGRYKKTVDQPRLTAAIDTQLVSDRCPSFNRFMRCVRELVELG